MATLKRRLLKINQYGTYDTLHFETSSDLVIRPDGTKLEDTLKRIGGSAKVLQITLNKDLWDTDHTQTVGNIDIKAVGFFYIPSPDSDDDYAAYTTHGIRGRHVTTDGQATFVCKTIPPVDIVVNLARVEEAK